MSRDVRFSRTAGDALNLVAISSAIGAFFAYLPNIFAALLLLILGSTVGQFAGQTVAQSAESAGIEFAPALGKLVSATIGVLTAVTATHVVLEFDGHETTVPNATLLDQVARQ